MEPTNLEDGGQYSDDVFFMDQPSSYSMHQPQLQNATSSHNVVQARQDGIARAQQSPPATGPSLPGAASHGNTTSEYTPSSAAQTPLSATQRRRVAPANAESGKEKRRKGKAPYHWLTQDGRLHEAARWILDARLLGIPRAKVSRVVERIGGPKTSKPLEDLENEFALNGKGLDLGTQNGPGQQRFVAGVERAAKKARDAEAVTASRHSLPNATASLTPASQIAHIPPPQPGPSVGQQDNTRFTRVGDDVKRTSASQMDGKFEHFAHELYQECRTLSSEQALRNYLARRSGLSDKSYRASGLSHHTAASVAREAGTPRETHFRELARCFNLLDDVYMHDAVLADLISEAIERDARDDARLEALLAWREMRPDQQVLLEQLFEHKGHAKNCDSLEPHRDYRTTQQRALAVYDASRDRMANLATMQSIQTNDKGVPSNRGGIPVLFLAVKLGLPRVCGVLLWAGAKPHDKVAGTDAYDFARQAVRQAEDEKHRWHIKQLRLKVAFGFEQPSTTSWATKAAQQTARSKGMTYPSLLELCNKLDPDKARMQARAFVDRSRLAIGEQSYAGSRLVAGPSNAVSPQGQISTDSAAEPNSIRAETAELWFLDLWTMKGYELNVPQPNTPPIKSSVLQVVPEDISTEYYAPIGEPMPGKSQVTHGETAGSQSNETSSIPVHNDLYRGDFTAEFDPLPHQGENAFRFAEFSPDQGDVPGLESVSPDSGFQSSAFTPGFAQPPAPHDDTLLSTEQPMIDLNSEQLRVVEDFRHEADARLSIPTDFTAQLNQFDAAPFTRTSKSANRTSTGPIETGLRKVMAGGVGRLRHLYGQSAAPAMVQQTPLPRAPALRASTTTLQGDRVAQLIQYYASRGEDRTIWVSCGCSNSSPRCSTLSYCPTCPVLPSLDWLTYNRADAGQLVTAYG